MASKIKVTRQKVEMLEKEGPETPVCTENLTWGFPSQGAKRIISA